jgi:glycosyltransferase involved in cell wall biosynthesis
VRPLRIAVLDEELPFPPTSGKRIRTFNLLRRLADRHRITYVAHRNPDAGEQAAAEAEFRRLGVETVVVDRIVPPKRGPRFYARLAGNLFSPLPYSVASHASRELRETVRRLAAERRFDLWHCEWTPYAEMMRPNPPGPWLVMAHNVESLIWRRYTETEPHPLKRWYVARQWHKFERFERWAYSHATRTVAVSPDDADLIRRDFGGARVDVVDNGVDTAFFQPPDPDRRDPKHVLFLGSLDWRPNLDAVQVLLADIFPRVRAAEPAARLVLVGRNPPDWLRESPGVEVHANVPDVRPFLHRCGQMAVPLRVGGGSRLKILEALATALPVVSTAVGAEGLQLDGGRHLTLADDPAAFANALLAGMRDPTPFRQLAERGRQVVLRQYDWEPLARRLEEVWMDCAAGSFRSRIPQAVTAL